jgi:phosphoglycolate phosphatase-like HAD superfamily hydrolase
MQRHHAAPALIFDVEGTLVDCVEQTLESWRETLADFGLNFSIKQLHPYSGMHGAEMLDHLLRSSKASRLKHEILAEQGARYRKKFLRTVRPFPGVRALFESIKELDRPIGLATTCQPDELSYYGSILGVFDLIDAIACGEDVERGKPHPDLFIVALQRLGVEGQSATALGDTPYDAMAAARAGIVGIAGTLTGGFSRKELQTAGCQLVVESVTELLPEVQQRQFAHSE